MKGIVLMIMAAFLTGWSVSAQNMDKGELRVIQDPRVDTLAVISPGFYSFGIQGDNAVNNLRPICRRNENDHISPPDFLPVVRNGMQLIPGLQRRIHAGTIIIL